MNSSEQKDFEHITPTEDQVAETINQIQAKLESAGEKGSTSEEDRQGYQLAMDILKQKETDYQSIISQASSDRSKTIAALALNYLNGESSADILLNYTTHH